MRRPTRVEVAYDDRHRLLVTLTGKGPQVPSGLVPAVPVVYRSCRPSGDHWSGMGCSPCTSRDSAPWPFAFFSTILNVGPFDPVPKRQSRAIDRPIGATSISDVEVTLDVRRSAMSKPDVAVSAKREPLFIRRQFN